MKINSPYLIPFYVPQKGCKHRCIYCNSFITTDGENKQIDAEYFKERVDGYLSTRKGRGTHVELAFYGGSFNSIKDEERNFYLFLTKALLDKQKIDALRVSLRPKPLDDKLIEELAKHKTKTVELGIQSFSDEVLRKAERGHNAKDVREAFKILKDAKISISAHLMLGLPGDSKEGFFNSLAELIKLKPDFVRIHPTVILKGTTLESIHNRGEYEPLSLETAVEICSKAVKMLKNADIRILRLGLQANDLLSSGKGVLAGPYHPTFGEMALSKYLLSEISDEIRRLKLESKKEIEIKVNDKQLSKFLGENRVNIEKLKMLFGFEKIKFVPDPKVRDESFLLF